MFWLNLIVRSNETQYVRASNPLQQSFSFCSIIKMFCKKKKKKFHHKEATQEMCHMSVTWYVDVGKIASCKAIADV